MWLKRSKQGRLAVVLSAVFAFTPRAATAESGESMGAPSLDAQASSSAAALLERGVELREMGRDAEALEAFRAAHRALPSSESLAQQALAEQALGAWVDAHSHLREALAHRDHPWIARHRASLEEAFREIEAHLGRVEVSSNVVGAEVFVDGRSVGRTPLSSPLWVAAGSSVVSASADGYFSVSRPTPVDPSVLARVRLQLTPLPRASLEQGPGPAGAATSPDRSWAYASWAVASAGVVVGAVGFAVREINVARYNDPERCLATDRDRSEVCPEYREAFRSGETWAIAGLVSAGAFGALGLWSWLSADEASPAHSACAVGLQALSCRVVF